MDEIEKTPAGDGWRSLRSLTQARIGLGRTGDALGTDAVLTFEIAQAQARDAVHAELDTAALQQGIGALGLRSRVVASCAADRATYLRRPDLGRRLDEASRAALKADRDLSPGRLVVVLADGLSAEATARHALPLLKELRGTPGLTFGERVYVAKQARVALGDEVGELCGAEAVLVLIGERPGLSAPASLGAYLTWHPHVGRTDAERNCVSNVHACGLGYGEAAAKLRALIEGARRLGASGVALHDESDAPVRGLKP